MTPYELIRAKRDGGTLAPEALRSLLADYARGELPDYQMAALCMAVFFRGLDPTELRTWTEAMLHSGATLRRRPGLPRGWTSTPPEAWGTRSRSASPRWSRPAGSPFRW